MTRLSVNLNKVALLRNSRDSGIPSVIVAARRVIEAGAHGITVHPRPDERHIRPSDVYELADLLAGAKGVELNVEGNPFAKYTEIVRRVKPAQCTLVPDAPEQATSDHGWDLERDARALAPIIEELRRLGSRVSLFLDPDPAEVERAKKAGADRIELYTEPYARAFERGDAPAVLERYAEAARTAQRLGLGVNAGHDLNLQNLCRFLTISGILEVSIGHALIADALEMGLVDAVRAYLAVISKSRGAASS